MRSELTSTHTKQKALYFYIFIFLLYGARLLYMSLSYLRDYRWLANADEPVIYSLGLKWFTDHTYPYFGPEILITASTGSHLFGGLQGLLIGIPLFVWAHPVAPYLFLFILLSAALLYLSWYLSQLFPALPRWIIYTSVALSPLTIHTGLKVINPAYVLLFSVPFMLSLIEIFKIFPKQYIGVRWRYFWLGLGVTSVFQLHATWTFLSIVWLGAMIYTYVHVKDVKEKLSLFIVSGIGLVVGGLSVLPALYHYGVGAIFEQGMSVASFTIGFLLRIPSILYFFIVNAGYEMNSFGGSEYCWQYLMDHSYVVGALAFGILQVIGLLLFGFQLIVLFWRPWRQYVFNYKRMLYFTGFILGLLGFMYLFSAVKPKNYIFMSIHPLSAICLYWFLQGLFILYQEKVKQWYFYSFFSLLAFYYIITLKVTHDLPNQGYREKAFEAIEKKDADILAKPRLSAPKARTKSTLF